MRIRKRLTKRDVEIINIIRTANELNNLVYFRGLIDRETYYKNKDRLQEVIRKSKEMEDYIK